MTVGLYATVWSINHTQQRCIAIYHTLVIMYIYLVHTYNDIGLCGLWIGKYVYTLARYLTIKINKAIHLDMTTSSTYS